MEKRIWTLTQHPRIETDPDMITYYSSKKKAVRALENKAAFYDTTPISTIGSDLVYVTMLDETDIWRSIWIEKCRVF